MNSIKGGHHFGGVEAAILFCLFFGLSIVNKFLRAASGTCAVCLVVVPLTQFYPSWELSPWIRLHAVSLLVGVFVVQLIMPAATGNNEVQLKSGKFDIGSIF